MAEPILMTALSPTMDEGTISQWTKNINDTISSGDIICEVETDKASMEYESVQEGVLLKIIVEQGKSAKVGEPIAIIGEKGEQIDELVKTLAATPATSAPSASPSDGGTAARDTHAPPPSASSATQPADAVSPAHAEGATGRVPSSPLARHIANQHNIPLNTITGSGPGGRIVKSDVLAAVAGASPAGGAPLSAGLSPTEADQQIPVTATRKVIATRLAESKFSAPHYYLSVAINMRELIAARSLLNSELRRAGTKVSFNAFLIKFAAEAIRRNPNINSSWDGEYITQFGSIDIALAVDGKNGLITPVVRNCAAKGVVDIDTELTDLIGKAQDGTLAMEEYTNATFTISNLGSYGIESFTAIINPPGSAILAIGQTHPTPVATADGNVTVEQIMKVNLSCDHRVIDGVAAARFLAAFKGFIETPARLVF